MTEAEALETLRAADPERVAGAEAALWAMWCRSGRRDLDALLAEGIAAMERRDFADALARFTRLVEASPEWAEAWNKRATIRFMGDDEVGAMEDIAEVLRREPRHFGAIVGMASILQQAGLKKAALTAYRKALEIYPQQANVRTVVEKLTIEVEGRDI
jgi:tetratricopeptide (TPR) repeat protein